MRWFALALIEVVDMGKDGFYAKYIKRLLDIITSAVFLILFWWLYVIIAILVRTKLGSPVLFKQKRPLKNGEIGDIVKFRTMTNQRDSEGNLLPDKDRLTPFGKFLRASSLDELPEVWLVLIGRLSWVGPRPLMPSYLELYSPEQMRRHEVRQGVTGYAQAYGRNLLSWQEKFEKDVFYVDHVSLWLDIKILFKTVAVVVKREGISSETSATMEEFTGNKSEEKINV